MICSQCIFQYYRISYYIYFCVIDGLICFHSFGINCILSFFIMNKLLTLEVFQKSNWEDVKFLFWVINHLKKVDASLFNDYYNEIKISFRNLFYRTVTDFAASFWNFTFFWIVYEKVTLWGDTKFRKKWAILKSQMAFIAW